MKEGQQFIFKIKGKQWKEIRTVHFPSFFYGEQFLKVPTTSPYQNRYNISYQITGKTYSFLSNSARTKYDRQKR